MSAAEKAGRVSVVVASYNHARYLVRRMESLIAQTYADVEILVIDDCSTDDSVEVLRRYESHPRVSLVVREANAGWVAVSNQGLHMASGEFVIFANCDDDCDPDMIARLVAGLRAHPTAGIAYCRSLIVDRDDEVLGDDFSMRERSFRVACATDTLISGPQMSRYLLYSCVIPNLSGALFRRECLAVTGDFSSDYRVCSDWDLYFRIAARYDVFYAAEPMNRFRTHSKTVRSATKERIVYGEYIRLLLGQIGVLGLSLTERVRFRTRVMSLWAGSLISQSNLGLRDFPFCLGLVIRHDAPALFLLVPALILRCVAVLKIAIHGPQRDIVSGSDP